MNWRVVKLALGEAGASPWRAWPLAAGLALGVACLVFLLGLATQLEDLLRERILGSLPDRIRVSKAALQMGPVALAGNLDQQTIDTIKQIDGVAEVFAQARFPEPCQLTASYGGENLITDLVLEGVDPGQVAPELEKGRSFHTVSERGEAVPAVIPRYVIDLVNAGISVNTNLPNLSATAILGRHFELRLGTSSFNPGPYTTVRCVIVGVSDQIGVGGPAVPLEQLRQWTEKDPQIHTLTVRVTSAEKVGDVAEKIRQMGLETPGLETARRLSQALAFGKVAVTLFCLCILATAGAGLSSSLALQVKEEAPFIGLYRAVGATRHQIMMLYLTRAGALGVAGAAVGCSAGSLFGLAVNQLLANLLSDSFLDGAGVFRVSPSGFLVGVTFCLGVSLLSGWWPARRAAAMPPAAALRGE